MKIIGGKFKGRNFFMPKTVRPTQDLMRKALFDILGQDISGLTFIDIFAGSGAMGLEAISRGAAHVTFVERDSRHAEIIQENLKVLNIRDTGTSSDLADIIASDAFVVIKQLAREEETYDIVFVDPPYDQELAKKALKTLGAYDILHPDSILIIQHNKHEILPSEEGRIIRMEQRRYGSAFLSLYKK